MCGIAGIMNFDEDRPVDRGLLQAMADAIAHRGPDAEGLWIDDGVGLAHRRLSIIDLEGGDQPLANEDGSIQVVFNGEIYNYRELHHQLAARGHSFRTRSDTEVLVHLYEEHGAQMVDRLRGMFAFAVYDRRRRRLLLARDRVGLKPLYYSRNAAQVLFASEIKPLLADPEMDRTVDLEALEEYLTYGIIPGERSIFRDIRKLPPGCVLSIDADNPRRAPQRYWRLEVCPNEDLGLDEWTEALEDKLRETIRLHLVSDVPVGAFLSGGLDSSTIVAGASELASGPLQTFSIGFQEETFSELPHARRVAEAFGTKHFEEVVTPGAVESLENLVHHYDEPFADSSAIPTLCVSRVARQHVKVVLSGDGGDEAFGGYSRYVHDLREARIRQWIPNWVGRALLRPLARAWPKADWLPRAFRAKSTLHNLSLEPASAYAHTLSICRLPMRRRLMTPELNSALNGFRPEDAVRKVAASRSGDPLSGMINADVAVLLPDDFLTKVDRASMAVGLEVRPPLVDHEFLELAARVPSKWKVHRGTSKWIFKRMAGSRLPHDVVHRRKQGFEIPVDDWLRGPLRGMFEDVVLSAGGPVSAYIDSTYARRLYQAHLRRVGRHGHVLWSLLVLGCWAEKYLSRVPSGNMPPMKVAV